MKISILPLLAILPFSALSEDAKEESPSCEIFYELGKSIMSARQEGVEVISVLKVFKDSPQYKPLILEAYKRPRYNGEAMKNKTTLQFANEIFLECEKLGSK